jgi:hypothetical protein
MPFGLVLILVWAGAAAVTTVGWCVWMRWLRDHDESREDNDADS